MEHAAPALDEFYRDVRTQWFERIEAELWGFGNDLNRWLHELFNSQSTEWRRAFDAFLAEQASLGRVLTPEGEEQLLAFLNDWETRRTVIPGGADRQGFAKLAELAESWPALSEEDRERTRDSYGLPGWYAKPLEWGDREWEKAFEELGRKSRDHMLAVCRQLELLGEQAKRSEQSDEDGTEHLERLKQSVQAAHDEYVLSIVELQQNWLLYIQEHWFIGLQIQKLIDRLDANLPPRLFDLTSPHSKTLASATHEVGKALGEVVDRVDAAYTTAVWTDRAITAVEIVTAVGAIGAGARTVLKAAVKKGIAIQIAKRMAVKYAIKQLAVQSVAYATAGYVVPRLLAASGLNRDFVFTGLMIVQGLGMVQAVRSAQVAGQKVKPPSSNTPEVLPKSPTPDDPPVASPNLVEPAAPKAPKADGGPKSLEQFFRRDYWKKSIEFRGLKVYQRDDLIDPQFVGPEGFSNLELMRAGYAPLTRDGRDINLHHLRQRKEGPLFETSARFHEEHSAILHPSGNSKESEINRSRFARYRRAYWMHRSKDFE